MFRLDVEFGDELAPMQKHLYLIWGQGGTIHGHTVLVISKVYLLVIVLIIEFINIIYI